MGGKAFLLLSVPAAAKEVAALLPLRPGPILRESGVRWMIFADNLLTPEFRLAKGRRLGVAALNIESPFHKRSLRHRQLGSGGTAGIHPNLDQHGDWTDDEERIERRVDDLIQAHHHF